MARSLPQFCFFGAAPRVSSCECRIPRSLFSSLFLSCWSLLDVVATVRRTVPVGPVEVVPLAVRAWRS